VCGFLSTNSFSIRTYPASSSLPRCAERFLKPLRGAPAATGATKQAVSIDMKNKSKNFNFDEEIATPSRSSSRRLAKISQCEERWQRPVQRSKLSPSMVFPKMRIFH
jgi:hypothetical protein